MPEKAFHSLTKLIEESIGRLAPELPAEGREAIKNLVIKVILMTSSPETSIREVEDLVLDFVEGEGGKYRGFLREG